MMAVDPTTIDDLFGHPVNARDVLTAALVQPETLDALLAAMNAQETPTEAADPLATALFDTLDQYIRKKIGPLPWVRHTLPGTVLSVGTTTCTMAVAGIDHEVRDVLFGPNRPAVGDSYPVRFPVSLPPEGVPLAKGPQPYGQPWIKVTGGATWLYYVGRTAENRLAWYRVPLPPAGDTEFEYDPDAATLIAVKGTFPTYGFWGGETLTGVTQTYHTNHLWIEDSFWSNNRDTLKGLIPIQRPQRTQLRSYPQLGADPDNPAGQDAAPYLTSYPWLHLAGSNLDFEADADYLLGFQYSADILPVPTDNPSYRFGDYYNVRIAPANAVGPSAWTQRSTALLFGTKMVFTFYPPGGYHLGSFQYTAGELADACGWTATATTQWATAGHRISYWAVQQLTPDPFPDPNEIVPLDNNHFILDRYNLSPARIRVFVAVDNGPAAEVALPGQPSGWVEPYPGFFLRPSGGETVRCWWAGMPSFVQSQPGGPGTAILFTTTPIRLWRGDINLNGGGADWAIADGGVGLNRLVAVNGDASVVAAVVAGTSTNTTYLTQDAGATWTLLPPPPHVVRWGVDVPRMRLIDTTA